MKKAIKKALPAKAQGPQRAPEPPEPLVRRVVKTVQGGPPGGSKLKTDSKEMERTRNLTPERGVRANKLVAGLCAPPPQIATFTSLSTSCSICDYIFIHSEGQRERESER